MFFLMLMQHLLRAGYVFVENILLIPNDPVLNYISTWLTLNTQCAQDSVLWEIQCTLFNRNRRDMLTWKKRAKKKKRILEVRTILPFYYNASVAVITIPFLWNDLALTKLEISSSNHIPTSETFSSMFHFMWWWKPQRGVLRCFPPWPWFSFLPLIYTLTGVTRHIWKGLFPWNDLIDMLGFDVWCLSKFYDSTFPCICLLSLQSVSERFATLRENCSHCIQVNKGVLYLLVVDNGCIYSAEI